MLGIAALRRAEADRRRAAILEVQLGSQGFEPVG